MSTERIRQLNDAFRRSLAGGRVLTTLGVEAFSNMHKTLLLERVRTFDAFPRRTIRTTNTISAQW
ncbi:MAG: hypothetical protein JO001_14205 [Alphaproteobacteria bacterium]|nr:hypothetical protein [Alphaproteobacteria bacterium]